jgi:hypothetical protein
MLYVDTPGIMLGLRYSQIMIIIMIIITTPWPESASELYRQSERRLSAKLVPTFADRGLSRSQRGGSLRP